LFRERLYNCPDQYVVQRWLRVHKENAFGKMLTKKMNVDGLPHAMNERAVELHVRHCIDDDP
jgi:hypothetical protein